MRLVRYIYNVVIFPILSYINDYADVIKSYFIFYCNMMLMITSANTINALKLATDDEDNTSATVSILYLTYILVPP